MSTRLSESAQACLKSLSDLLGPGGYITDADAQAPYLTEARGNAVSTPLALLRPSSTQEVAAVVRLTAEAGIALVPQGGNTGLVGGALAAEGSLLLNLGRLNRIREVDPLDHTMTVEAGVILATVQQAANDVDLMFPLSLGAEGSCTIGGNLSTNAGGILTLRYGNARAQVLGLEVVLPDGQVWNGLRRLRKDNTGYDLKHLFLGAEGTLGIITAATLSLVPRPRQMETALVAVPDVTAALRLLKRLRQASGDAVSAFEIMPRFAIDGAARYLGEQNDPLSEPSPWYILTELTAGTPGDALRDTVEAALAEAIDAGEASDATLAASGDQRQKLWRLREGLPEIGRKVGGALHHDVAVPVSRVPQFIERANQAVAALCPGARPYPFGHLGDGNIHYNIARPDSDDPADRDAFLALGERIMRAVHDVVLDLDGSISAEHGIGNKKRNELARARSPLEIDLMASLKRLLDPRDLMNPGKILPQ
ncbi:FAD-binding oxidoreductase [Nitrospirillum amazonense]|uniref:FAD-binding oxidoreductase n=1 Tax=Nitrospirillum amazonense TaxID=28077 RepID=UPI002DD44FE9|nr:FAD-binding oxidoreductase [Nitrospirillum amazonense]MEC4594324.1 FAD-binding oxidoreductase [Nitrospirillum amazonense]